VLLEIGRLQRKSLQPDIDIMKNEVGSGHPGTVAFAIRDALAVALAPFGSAAIKAAQAAVSQALFRHRIVWGLGVGSPDLVGSVGGRWCGLELKREHGGVVSEVQEQWHNAARKRSCFVTVIRTVEEVAPALDRCRRGEVE
jgi:hypothetical protein